MFTSTIPTRRWLLAAAIGLPLAAGPVSAQGKPPALFRVVAPGLDVTIGLTAAESAALGPGPVPQRLGEQLVARGSISAWQYVVGRGADGALRHVTTWRIALTLTDGMHISPYTPALPVSPPPAS